MLKQKKTSPEENSPLHRTNDTVEQFRKTCPDVQFYFKFKFTIETKKLSIFRLSNKRLLRLELMNYLSNIGYSNKQICEFLDTNKIKTVRKNKKYTQNDVWTGLKKYRERLSRFNQDTIYNVEEYLIGI